MELVESATFLTTQETVLVIASHIAMGKVFNCFECKKLYPEQKRKELKGCHAPIKKPVARYKDRINFYKCPSNFYNPMIGHLANQASKIDKGLLPYEGGLFDQPAKLIEIFNLLESLRIDDELQRLEAESKKQKQEAKKWQARSKFR